MLRLIYRKKYRMPFLIKGFIYFSLFLLIATLFTCIDPYYPNLDNYESLLVVEGLITDENRPYEVRLSRTALSKEEDPEVVTDADVFITNEEKNVFNFQNAGNGIYRSDSTEFTGIVGKTYILHIKTGNGKQYESKSCLMQPVPDIDTLYFDKDERFTNDQEDIQKGITIYLDSEEGDECSKYYRWDYEETWKFRIPNPHRYEYFNDTLIVLSNNVREYCWKSHKSGDIQIRSVMQGEAGNIHREPVCFIPSATSDRLTIGYSIFVRQYSISEEEYDFWSNLKQINESGGDIFEKQPYPVISNIFNPEDPEEKVLGYFQVSGVKGKKLFINPMELEKFKLPVYKTGCLRFVVSPDNYPSNPPAIPPMTFDSIYYMFMITGDFTFVEPLYNAVTGELMKLVFSLNACSKCELMGNPAEPEFWDEFE